MRRWLVLLMLASACSPGVGREPMFRDAGPGRDGGFRDAGPPGDGGDRDGGARDGNFGTRDGGPPPVFPFTGVFEIYDSAQQLFAREVDGRLLIVVGGPPYVFTGTIDEDGVVDLTSPSLDASGCNRPRITGTYERTSTLYELQYRACNERLEVYETELRGLFANDYDHQRSGTYEVTSNVTSNVTGCWSGDQTVSGSLWGVSFLADRTAIVFTGRDLVAIPNVYIGSSQAGTFTYDATHKVTADATGEQYAISGRFERVTLNDPLMMFGERDVYDTDGACFFRVQFVGERIASP